MGFERDLSPVAPILFTADGGTQGQITLATTLGLFVKQTAILQASLLPPFIVEIKQVLSDTQILVGSTGQSINHRVDVSAYTVAQGSFIYAEKQPKAVLAMESRLYASYIQEPSNSWRVTPVDSFGNSIDSTNPLPVAFDGTISIGDVHILGRSPDNNELDVNPDGSISTDLNPLSTFQTSQYTVGTSPVQITPTPMPDRNSIGFKAVTVATTDAIWIGNSAAVTVSTGYPLFNRDTLEMDLEGGETIYAIASNPGQILCIVELGD